LYMYKTAIVVAYLLTRTYNTLIKLKFHLFQFVVDCCATNPQQIEQMEFEL